MTLANASARCRAAGLTVRATEAVGAQIRVRVATVPGSASGLAALTTRLGVGVAVSMGDGTGGVTLWFMTDKETAWQHE